MQKEHHSFDQELKDKRLLRGQTGYCPLTDVGAHSAELACRWTRSRPESRPRPTLGTTAVGVKVLGLVLWCIRTYS